MKHKVSLFPTHSAWRDWATLIVSLMLLLGLTQSCRRHKEPTTLQNASRPGSSDYDNYVKTGLLSLNVAHKLAAPSAVKTEQLSITGAIVNSGPRPVTGIELHGYLVDMTGAPLQDTPKQRYNVVYPFMPSQLHPGPLQPGQSMPFQINIANVPEAAEKNEIGDMRIEISGVTLGK